MPWFRRAPYDRLSPVAGSLARATAAALAWGAFCAAPAAPVERDFQVFIAHDDNVGRSERDADIADDWSLALSANAGSQRLIGTNQVIGLYAHMEAQRYMDLVDLSELSLGGTVRYRIKPQPDYDALWYELTGSARVLEHLDSDIRDSAVLSVGASTGRRLTDRIRGDLGYDFELRRAFTDDVFDTEQHRLSLNIDYDVAESIVLYATAAYLHGDVVSTAVPNRGISAAADAISHEPDSAFPARLVAGAGMNGSAIFLEPRAYRLEADTGLGELGLNIGLGRNLALDVSAQYSATDARGSNHYDDLILQAGLLWRPN